MAIHFTDDGAETRLELVDTGLQTVSNITLSAWYNPEASSQEGYLFHYWRNGGASQHGWHWGQSGGRMTFYSGTVESSPNQYTPPWWTSTATLVDDTWQHVLFTYDGSDSPEEERGHHYINGVEADNTFSPHPSEPESFTVGSGGWSRLSIGGFTSKVNEGIESGVGGIAAWTVTLTQDEITRLARGESPLDIQPNNLFCYYSFWGVNDDDIYVDLSGNNRHMLNGSGHVAPTVQTVSHLSQRYVTMPRASWLGRFLRPIAKKIVDSLTFSKKVDAIINRKTVDAILHNKSVTATVSRIG